MTTQKYKRSFGPQEANTPPAALNLPRCQQCGKTNGICALPVLLKYASTAPSHTVCYKNLCVFCGTIQHWETTDNNGQPCIIPAFYVLHTQSKKALTMRRDFSLPRELYQTADGKADVGLKVRIIDSLLRLQLERPTDYMFGIKEVLEGLQ